MTRAMVPKIFSFGGLAVACSSQISNAQNESRRPDAFADASTPLEDSSRPVSADATTHRPDATALTDAELHPTCVLAESSTLPHVRVVFTGTECVFTLAEARAGIAIPYDVVVDTDVPGFTPSNAYPYGANVSVLDVGELLDGQGQSYCSCDEGYPYYGCPLDDGGIDHSGCRPATIKQGVYHRTFTWRGRNWSGPSDTMNPEGPPFPPGDYTLLVSTADGTIEKADGGAADPDAGPPLRASGRFLVRLIP